MTEPTSTDWIRRFTPRPAARIRLVTLPHAGGSASFFAGLPARLGSEVDVLAVQYPGRQDRRNEPFAESVAELSSRLVAELRPWNDRPLALFGHSLGAVVAFEAARQLEASGSGPAALFVSGRRAPSRTRAESAHRLDDAGLIGKVRAMSGTDPRLFDDEELVHLVLPAIRADFRIIENYHYVPGPPLRCPLTVLTGVDDTEVSADEAEAWREHTSAAFTLATFPGGHFYLLAQAQEVADVVLDGLSLMARPSLPRSSR